MDIDGDPSAKKKLPTTKMSLKDKNGASSPYLVSAMNHGVVDKEKLLTLSSSKPTGSKVNYKKKAAQAIGLNSKQLMHPT